MSGYTSLSARKIPYHLNGTVVAKADSTTPIVPTYWFTQSELDTLNGLSTTAIESYGYGNYINRIVYFFFPEKMDIKHAVFRAYSSRTGTDYHPKIVWVEGSNDTTDGTDGTWTRASISGDLSWNAKSTGTDYNTENSTHYDPEAWYRRVGNVIFPAPVSVVRVYIYVGRDDPKYYNLHLYGNKEHTSTSDDILVLGSDGETEFTAPLDWGSVKEGESKGQTVYLKNNSTTKTANSISVSLSGEDANMYTLSTDEGSTYVTSKTIASLAPGEKQKLLLKTQILPHPEQLGPTEAMLRWNIDSWT